MAGVLDRSFIRDNRSFGSVGDYLKQVITANSDISIVSAYFTIYAYHQLKNNLDNINGLKFLFGEPTFIKSMDPNKTNVKDFKIEDDKLVIPLESRMTQRAIAKFCIRCWIYKGIEFGIPKNGTVVRETGEKIRKECSQHRTLKSIFHGIELLLQLPKHTDIFAKVMVGSSCTLKNLLEKSAVR